MSGLREKRAGTIRITSTKNAAEAVPWPALKTLLPNYPDIKVEIIIDYGLTDVVAERYDAGVRFGEQVARDMIAVCIWPDNTYGRGGNTRAFFETLPTHGLYAWEFEKNGRELRVRVDGQLAFNTTAMMLNAAAAGFGLAYLPEQQVQKQLASGELIRVLENWCPPFSGYRLHYPSRRQPSAAFTLLVDALCYRGARHGRNESLEPGHRLHWGRGDELASVGYAALAGWRCAAGNDVKHPISVGPCRIRDVGSAGAVLTHRGSP